MDFTYISSLLENDNPLIYQTNQAVLKMSGPDALDFLQRMSTNDCHQLKNSDKIMSAFLNHKGKIIDFVLINKILEDDFLLLSSFSDENKIYQWIENYHFLEKFSLAKSTGDFFPHVLIKKDAKQKLCFEFGINKPKIDFLSIGPDVFQLLRIANMIPLAPNEINEEFMPQEIGLEKYISFDKGCYIGQEVIAKSNTFQKNKKYLKGHCLSKEEWERAKSNTENFTSLAPFYVSGFINALEVSI